MPNHQEQYIWNNAGKEDPYSGWFLTLSVIIASFVTWMVYRSKKISGHRRGKYSGSFLFRLEIVADIMLMTSVSIFSFVFWEKGVMAMLSRASTDTFGDIWFLFVFLSILFLFFYLPLRYLYFIEDRGGGRNRRRLLIIFGFLLLKALFEVLAI